MAKSAQFSASTQKFIEIKDIDEYVVIFTNGTACAVLEVKATNFTLLSAEEQDSKILAYAGLLNALSFPIQIIIRNKKLDITSYVNQLDLEIKKTQNPSLAKQIELYKNFVSELVKVNTVLDKKFYISIPYSSLEKGVQGVTADPSLFATTAKTALKSKAETLTSSLARIGLKARVLDKEELVKLFHDIYNEVSLHPETNTQNSVTGGKK